MPLSDLAAITVLHRAPADSSKTPVFYIPDITNSLNPTYLTEKYADDGRAVYALDLNHGDIKGKSIEDVAAYVQAKFDDDTCSIIVGVCHGAMVGHEIAAKTARPIQLVSLDGVPSHLIPSEALQAEVKAALHLTLEATLCTSSAAQDELDALLDAEKASTEEMASAQTAELTGIETDVTTHHQHIETVTALINKTMDLPSVKISESTLAALARLQQSLSIPADDFSTLPGSVQVRLVKSRETRTRESHYGDLEIKQRLERFYGEKVTVIQSHSSHKEVSQQIFKGDVDKSAQPNKAREKLLDNITQTNSTSLVTRNRSSFYIRVPAPREGTQSFISADQIQRAMVALAGVVGSPTATSMALQVAVRMLSGDLQVTFEPTTKTPSLG